MRKISKKGFSLVELIVIVVIIGLLSGAAYIGIQKVKSKNMNDKVLDDLIAVSNAMEQYKRDHFGSYPIPTAGGNMNLNCFYADATYAHDCETASFIQGMIDNNLLTKRYLQEVPTDPRTGSRYVYGVTTDGKYFQVAGLYEESDGTWVAKVVGNVARGFHLPSLIRAFNGPNFVVEDGGNLPYSPDHMVISATLQNITDVSNLTVKDAQEQNVPSISPGMAVYTGYTVETIAPASTVDLYFSDGSVTHLDGGTKLKIQSGTEVVENDKDNLITKIRLKLFSGKIWNKVARLAEKSEFNIETTGAIAGVRGTEFGIDGSQILLYQGDVCILNPDATLTVDQLKACVPTPGKIKGFIATDALAIAPTPILQGISDATLGGPLAPESNEGLNNLMVEQTKHYLNDNISPHILAVNGLAVTIQNINDYYDVEQIEMDKIGYSADGVNLTLVDWETGSDGNYVINLNPQSYTNLTFRFEDTVNNLHSGNSTPPVNVSDGTLITEADLYGGVGGEVAMEGGIIEADVTSCQITLNYPANNISLTHGNPIYLTWYSADCTEPLDLYLNETIYAANITSGSYMITSLPLGDYTWQIKSGGSESEIRNFVIETAPICTDGMTENLTCKIKDTAMTIIGYGEKIRTCTCAPTCTWPSWDAMTCVAQYCNPGYKIDYETCKACNMLGYILPGNASWLPDCEWQCNTGYHQSGMECVSDECTYGVTPNQTQNCAITNGTGGQTRACTTTSVWGDWSACSVQSCDDGYQILGNSCGPTLQTSCVGIDATAGRVEVTDLTATTIGYKNQSKGTYYSLADSSCWVKGDMNQNCSNACSIKLAGSSCVAGDWNADNNICTALGATTSMYISSATDTTNSFAPYLISTLCKLRNTSYTGIFNCDNSPVSSYLRICKCE